MIWTLICLTAIWIVLVICWFKLRQIDRDLEQLKGDLANIDEDLSQQGWNIGETRKCIENIKANHSALVNACADRFSNLD